jgi:predicted alpha/beta hydrolase family esterase
VRPQILFIQGGGGEAHKEDEKLVASLRNALGAEYEVRYPKMPKESEPDYRRWTPQIGKEMAAVTRGLILVGHSLGGSFLLKYLSEKKIETHVAGLFLIATPYWGDGGWRYEGYEAVALPQDFASKLPKRAPIFFYHSNDDEIVPSAHLALYEEKLPHATIRVLDGRGHQLNNDLSEVAADIRSLQ